jgi:hypothetical protein
MPGFNDADLEALARVIQSEVGPNGTGPERIAVGWVARNRARKRGTTIARMAMPPAKQGKGRPFSSARPATEESRAAALTVLSSAEDPTGGATSAFEPALQDKLFAEGRKGYSLDAGAVRAKWLRELDYYGAVETWDLFGPKGGKGARPVPESWGLGRTPKDVARSIRGPGTIVNVTRAGSGGTPWLLLLLLALAFKRR